MPQLFHLGSHKLKKKEVFFQVQHLFYNKHLVYFQRTLFVQNAVYYAISFEINEYPPIAIQNGRIDIY